MDTNSRSLAKAISYRLLGSLATSLIFFVFTGQLTLSLGAGGIDMVVKLGLYFVHERIWNHITFGRPKPPEYEI
jgi:adenylylsulfate kinase